MKTDISFKQGAERKFDPPNMFSQYSNWLVELQALSHPETRIVELVLARCFDEAVYNAFWTRNIAADWKVTEVEEVFDENS